jgi:hypothetical protein
MPTPLYVRVTVWLWLIAALIAGRFGLLTRFLGPGLQILLLGLTAAILLLYFKMAALRTWIDSLDPRALVLPHVTRFVGFYFLVLYQRGELPYAFAVPSGWGDILVAALVLPVCLLPLADATRRSALTIWNVFGFVDILMVLATAARLGLQDPAQLRALTYLPLSLLPTFLVPLILATHVVLFVRLSRESPRT